MRTIAKEFLIIGLVILYFALNHTATGASEPNKLTPAESQLSVTSEKASESHLIEVLISRLDVLFGFLLGLFGTIFVDYLRKRRSVKEFREGARSELRQVLGMVNWYTFNLDSQLNAEKIRSMQKLFKEFDLYKTLNPLGERTALEEYIDRNLTDEDIRQLVAIREASMAERTQRGACQSFRKLKYTFIQNNTSSISLLPKEDQALLMNILWKLEAINEVVPRLDFCFQKSYDANVTPENHERLRTVYLQSCQFISDWSHETAKEIAHFLRQTAT